MLAVLIAAAVAIASPARAGSAADSARTGEEFFAPPGWLGSLELMPYGDLRVVAERVEDRPGATQALRRAWFALRAGLDWNPRDWPIEARAGLRGGLGSDRNAESRAAFDNLAPDTVEVDELWLRLANPSGIVFSLGKMASPLALSELVWDADLRPVGAALRLPLPAPGTRFAAAAFTRSELSLDDARVAVGQLVVTGEPWSGGRAEVVGSLLAHDRLQDLARQGLARQNGTIAVGGGRELASDFRVAHVQLAAAGRWAGVPLSARVEAARNLAASRSRDAARVRLAAGGTEAPAGLELGWTHQRIEADAVCAAFNSDDWWFHSRARGNLFWAAAGVGRDFGAKLSASVERRDDLARDTRRYRAEITARLPAR